MDSRIIKINSFNDTFSLKLLILQKLKLTDYKKEYVSEFNEKLKSYLERNRNLKLIFQFDNVTIKRDINIHVSLKNRKKESYPDNYEMGNPHNRWFSVGRQITEEERLEEEILLKRYVDEKLMEFNIFCNQLLQISTEQISIIHIN